MPVIVIANPKGGVGKSTLATQVAGCLAHAGHAVMLGDADRLLVPLQPSLFDIQATHAFVGSLRQHPRAAQIDLALVGMRVKEHTLANEQLHHYLATLSVPVVAWLRDTQNYVQLAARGLTLWDVAPSRVERDLEQWAPLVDWLAR